METTSKQDVRDRLLRHKDDFLERPLGLTALDQAKRSGGPHITRSRLLIDTDGYQSLKVPAGWLLCKGAAVGRCKDGLVRHVRPYHVPQQFVGFAEGMLEGDLVRIWSRGHALLFIHGLNEVTTQGTRIYVTDADTFTITPEEGSLEIGVLLFVQPDRQGWGGVAFKSFDDPKPYL